MNTVSCPNCGHPNADTAKFCAKCGMKLSPPETLVFTPSEPTGARAPDPAPIPPPARPAAPPMTPKEQAGFSPSPAPAYTPPPAFTPTPAAPYSPPAAAGPVSTSGHRFVAMGTIAGLANILAIVSAVLGFLGGLIFGWQGIGGPIGILGGLVLGAIAGALGWIYWRLLGEAIWVILDIESNTRRTAAALEERR